MPAQRESAKGGSSIIDLSAYRTTRQATIQDKRTQQADAQRAVEEIAHHLLMAIRVIRQFHQ